MGGGYAFGKGLYKSDWRPRALGSRYDYQGTLFDGGADLDTTFDGEASFASVLVGYQIRRGAITLKLFAGAEARTRTSRHATPAIGCRSAPSASGYRPESCFDLSTA